MEHGSRFVCTPAELRLNWLVICIGTACCFLLLNHSCPSIGCYCCRTVVEKELQQFTVSPKTPKKHVTHNTNFGCQLLSTIYLLLCPSAYSFYSSLTLMAVSISAVIWAITDRTESKNGILFGIAVGVMNGAVLRCVPTFSLSKQQWCSCPDLIMNNSSNLKSCFLDFIIGRCC